MSEETLWDLPSAAIREAEGKPCWIELNGDRCSTRATFVTLCYDERGDICAAVRVGGNVIAKLVHPSRVTRREEET